MNIKQRRLPQAYQEVEWIGSNADACLMTNYVPTVDTIVECEAYCENGNSIFGVFDDNAFRYNITGGSATSKTAYFPTSSSKTFAVTEGFHKFTYGKNLYCDDVLIHTFSGTFQLTTSLTLAIFARNNNNNHFQDRLKGKIKPLKIIENNSVQAFLIPCYRISDSVIGMYDTIGGTFYTNQGTGTFTKGADVVTVDAITIPEGNVVEMTDSNGNVLFKKHKVHFQQLIQSTNGNNSWNGITYIKNANGSWTISGTTQSSNCFTNINYSAGVNSCNFISGHQYVVHPTPPNIDITTDFVLRMYNDGGNPYSFGGWGNYPFNNPFTVIEGEHTSWARWQAADKAGVTINQTVYPMLFDITAMFADCPQLMPTTYQQFRDMFPAEYYPYTAQPYDVWI